MKRTNILYWIFTVLFALIILSSALPNVMMTPESIDLIHTRLGYPEYFIMFVGVAKILGASASSCRVFRAWGSGLMLDYFSTLLPQLPRALWWKDSIPCNCSWPCSSHRGYFRTSTIIRDLKAKSAHTDKVLLLNFSSWLSVKCSHSAILCVVLQMHQSSPLHSCFFPRHRSPWLRTDP